MASVSGASSRPANRTRRRPPPSTSTISAALSSPNRTRRPGLSLPPGCPKASHVPSGSSRTSSSSPLPGPAESRRDNARHVEDEHVLGGHECDELREAQVAHLPARAVQDEQAARGAVGQGMLGDELRRQLVVEVGRPIHEHLSRQADGRDPRERRRRALYRSKIVGCSETLGGVKPKCRYAPAVAQRPRGVRARNPCCMRKGSYTSSSVPASSPTAAAMVVSPTGPPSNCSMMVFRIRPSMSSRPNSSTSSRFNASTATAAVIFPPARTSA